MIKLDPHKLLAKQIKLFHDRQWINSYFDLLKHMIEFTGLKNDDARLVLSIPSNKILPVTINRRYVLAASFRGTRAVGLIFSSQFSRIPALKAKAVDTWRYKPFSGETQEEAPYFIWLKDAPHSIFADEITSELEDEWREAVIFEVEHGKSSPFRKYHERVVYEAAVNLTYRRELLDEAFLTPPAV